jgi:hypothetical protein
MMTLKHAWSRGKRCLRPSITQYLNFAAFHGTSIEEILVSPETAAAEPLMEGALATFKPYRACRSIKSTMERLAVALDRLALSDIKSLPSATVIASVFDVLSSDFMTRMPAAVGTYRLKRMQSGKEYGKADLRRAFACAVPVLRRAGADCYIDDMDSIVADVAARSRSSADIARCGVQAAIIVLELLSQVRQNVP